MKTPLPARNKCRTSILTAFLAVLLSCATLYNEALAEAPQYNVIKVVDGDTFVATDGNLRFKVRMAGIDAPEKKQAYGEAALKELEKILGGKSVNIKSVGRENDMYGRVLGEVCIEGKDAGILMIEAGLATYYRPKCQEYPENKKLYDYNPPSYVKAEKAARAKQVGIWAQKNFQLPCQFRHLDKRSNLDT